MECDRGRTEETKRKVQKLLCNTHRLPGTIVQYCKTGIMKTEPKTKRRVSARRSTWQLFVKHLVKKHKGEKTFKEILSTYSKKEYEEFKKNNPR